MEGIAPAPPVRWRSESKEIGGFYTFLPAEVDKIKAAEGKMRTHAMKQCNVLLKEYVSFNPYVQRLYFEHIRSKKHGDSRYPQAYRCSMARLRSPSVWDSSPPMVFRRPSSVGPNHIMSETSSTSGYESSDQTRARIMAKTPKPEQGRKKSPEGSSRAEASRNPERESGKNKSPVLIRYRSPDSNPERPSQGSPYRISEGSPFKYRKAGSQSQMSEMVDAGSYRHPQTHRQLQLDDPTFARVMATRDSEVVSEVSRFLSPTDTRSGSRADFRTGFSSGSSEQSIPTPVVDSSSRHTARTGPQLGSSVLSSSASSLLAGIATSSTSSSSSVAGLPSSTPGDLQHRHSLFSRTATTRSLDAASQGGNTILPRTTSGDVTTSSSERVRDRIPGVKEVSFDDQRGGGAAFQDEGTQTYSERASRTPVPTGPGYGQRYGTVQGLLDGAGSVSPPRRSDPDFTTATSATAAATTTAAATSTATRNEFPDQASSTRMLNASSSRLQLPGGGIYTYKVPAGGSYRVPDQSVRMPEAKLVEGSNNVYIIEDATQYKMSESRASERVPVGQLLYANQTRTPEAETRSRSRAADGLRPKRKMKKVAAHAHRCDVNDLVPEQRRVRRRSLQNRIPETRKYMFYKYYGFAGQGAKTSWVHNRPLGLSPPHAHKAEDEIPDIV